MTTTLTNARETPDLSQVFSATGDMLRPPLYFAWKTWAERAFALLLLIPGLPMIGLLIVLVRLTSRGPAIFRQTRVGYRGRIFTMLKVRTMVVDAEVKTGPVWSSGNDQRITPLGRVLRKLHLDELPQLFNVLAGEMALIGPRPERPEIAARLAENIPGYWRRLAVLPGITGLAQVNLPADTDLESVRRKLVLDLEYIRVANLPLDLRMFACSLLRLIGVPGNIAMHLLLLSRRPQIPPNWYPSALEAAASVAEPTEANRDLWWVRPGATNAPSVSEEKSTPLDSLSAESWPALRATP
ncbi:MAG TPA: sugar transferase [Pirellulaceae bacterium]|nr:sugar transferase [Pirellulaceae bacterium]